MKGQSNKSYYSDKYWFLDKMSLSVNKPKTLLTPHSTRKIKEKSPDIQMTRMAKDSLNSIKKNKEDPTALPIILDALKSSSKRRSLLSKLNDDDPNICLFKRVGDISHLSISPGCSFREKESSDEDTEDNLTLDDSSHSTPTLNQSISLEEDEEQDKEDISFLEEIFITKLQIDQERERTAQLRYQERRDIYLSRLKTIRETATERLREEESRQEDNKTIYSDKQKMLESHAMEEATKTQQKYLQDADDRWINIQNEIESVKTKEVEEMKKHATSVLQFQRLLDNFTSAYESLRSDIRNQSLCINETVEQSLNLAIKRAKAAFEKVNTDTYSSQQLDLLKQELLVGLGVLRSIKDHIDAEKASKKTEAGVDPGIVEPPPIATPTEPVSPDIPKPPEVPASPTVPVATSISTSRGSIFTLYHNKYKFLHKKAQEVSQQSSKILNDTSWRPLLARGVGIVNLLNNVPYDSSNRSKLQQIFNILAGRPFTIGETKCNLDTNPAAAAFIKDQISSTVITLAHDRQVNSMAIYSSLIIRIWVFYPDVGDLILFRLYEACPFLVPLSLKRTEGQSDEEFHRSLGMRHKEGAEREPIDKYLTRMGNLAQLYGRIVSMEVKDSHPHGLEEGWKWLARTLSLPPYPSVTASLLNGFISIAGNALLKTYNRQCRKLLLFISQSYIPLLERESLEGGEMDLASLKKLISQFQATSMIPPPESNYKLII